MKKIIITTLLIIATGTITNLSAQNIKQYCATIDNHDFGDNHQTSSGFIDPPNYNTNLEIITDFNIINH